MTIDSSFTCRTKERNNGLLSPARRLLNNLPCTHAAEGHSRTNGHERLIPADPPAVNTWLPRLCCPTSVSCCFTLKGDVCYADGPCVTVCVCLQRTISIVWSCNFSLIAQIQAEAYYYNYNGQLLCRMNVGVRKTKFIRQITICFVERL